MRRAVFVGACAGAAPDLDVFIRSAADPLLTLEYHRHFTHAVVVAPIIGLSIAALCKLVFFLRNWRYKELATFAIAGAVTHGFLDACTSYGTLLYLPFSNYRVSWDIISIIDPIFTLPLTLLVLFACVLRRPQYAKTALVLCCAYLCFGIIQRERAQSFAHGLAKSRGHLQVEQLTARPSLGNTILWRLVYRFDNTYYVDAVQLMPFSKPRHYLGASVPAYTRDERLPVNSVLGQDVERFRFFSQNYLYRYPHDPEVVGDLRYAMFPDSITPLWGIRVDLKKTGEHTEFVYFRDGSLRAFDRLWSMIQGQVDSD